MIFYGVFNVSPYEVSVIVSSCFALPLFFFLDSVALFQLQIDTHQPVAEPQEDDFFSSHISAQPTEGMMW